MKLSLKWLKDYIDTKLSTDELSRRLTMAGLEIEAVEFVGSDTVLELEVTPNRPDCLSILGLAREIGAITGKALRMPVIPGKQGAGLKDFNKAKLIQIEDKKDCARYIATLIRDVKISESPLKIKERLASMGIKAINNAADITNFVLMETGQPLHAFDYDKLAGGKIIVRRAKEGEKIVTLDGIERKLDPSILVIADAEKPVAIAGIMGGKDTEITGVTRNILLESAHFEMGVIRRACRSLGVRSDSSYRFERNVNREGVLTGADRATDLLAQLTGGQVSGRGEVSAKATDTAAKIKIKISDVESLLGIDLSVSRVKKWLCALGFKVSSPAPRKDTVTVIPPSFRADIQADVDVVEEIARMIGFDRLPSQMPLIKAVNIPVDNRPRRVKEECRRVLSAGGIDEIITHNMINSKALIKSQMAPEKALRIFNPLSQDQELMRQSLLPSMLQAALTNINRGQKDLRFYEIGKRYFIDGEKETLGILLTGRRGQDWRLSKKATVEFSDLKGLAARVFASLGIRPAYEENKFSALDAACSASMTLSGKYLGSLGRIEGKILNNWDIKNQDVYYAGIHLDEIYLLPESPLKYRPVSEFPAIIRDVSLAVNKDVAYKKIEDICLAQGADVLKEVHFIEQYLGDKIQPGFKGLVFSCHYQSNSRTLREDEVTSVHERILQTLIRELAAIRR